VPSCDHDVNVLTGLYTPESVQTAQLRLLYAAIYAIEESADAHPQCGEISRFFAVSVETAA